MEDVPFVPLWDVPWVYGVREDIEWTPVGSGWFTAAEARRRARRDRRSPRGD